MSGGGSELCDVDEFLEANKSRDDIIEYLFEAQSSGRLAAGACQKNVID
jgi:hypothetical protein